MTGKIFINYRRGDDAGFTQALYQRLEEAFKADHLFMDVEGQIKPGDDFVEVLGNQVAECDVMLVVIGPRWSKMLADRLGHLEDFVVIEISAALEKGKRVIPVLVGGAEMPDARELPDPIRAMARRNAVGLRSERFKADCQGLITALKEQLAAAQKEREASTEAERVEAEAVRRREEAEAAARATEAETRVKKHAAQGLSAEEIRKAEELANWQFVSERRDVAELRDHLARFPLGVTERYALAKLEELLWEGLDPTGDVEELKSFIDEFPDGEFAKAAHAKLAKLEKKPSRARAPVGEQSQVDEAQSTVAAGTEPPATRVAWERPPLIQVMALVAALVAVFVAKALSPALTEEVSTSYDTYSELDTIWVAASALIALVAIVPGIALFYGGVNRSRKVRRLLIEVAGIVLITALVWLAYGYTLSFSDGGSLNAYIGGFDKLFLSGVTSATLTGTIPEYVFFLLVMTNACAAAGILAGAFLGRIKFSAVVVLTALWITFVHIPLAHWVWGGGWMSHASTLDFSGAISMIIPVGASGLVGAYLMHDRGVLQVVPMTRQSVTMIFLGIFLQAVSWIGMIVGSHIAATPNGLLSAWCAIGAMAAAALVWVLAEWLAKRAHSGLALAWGALTGIAAIAPASGYISLVNAIILGITAALASFFLVPLLRNRLKLDEGFDVFGIFLVGGIVGTVGTGIFANESIGGVAGVLEGNLIQAPIQFYGALWAVGWSGLASLLLFKIVNMTLGKTPRGPTDA